MAVEPTCLDGNFNLYCGAAMLLLIPMYLFNRKTALREKLINMALTVFLAFVVGALCLERLFYYISNRAYLLQSRKLCADVFHRHCQWYVIGVMLSAVWLVLNFALPAGHF